MLKFFVITFDPDKKGVWLVIVGPRLCNYMGRYSLQLEQRVNKFYSATLGPR